MRQTYLSPVFIFSKSIFFDVWMRLGFGVLGYIMKKLDYPIVPLVLAMVLGRLAEDFLRRALTISGGSLSIFFTRPISALFLGAAILAYLTPVIRWVLKGLRRAKADTALLHFHGTLNQDINTHQII